jgi:hypothetical protein
MLALLLQPLRFTFATLPAMRNPTWLLFLLLLTPACFVARRTTNEPLRAEKIARLVPGHTTSKETVEILGAPTEVVQLAKRSAYRYDHTATKDTGVFLLIVGFFNSDTRADRAWVFFDENGVLTHVASELHASEVQYGMPWSKLRDD